SCHAHTKVTEPGAWQISSHRIVDQLERMSALVRSAVADDSSQLVELLCAQMAEHALSFSSGALAAAVAKTFECPSLGSFLVAEENVSGKIIGLAYVAFLHSMEHAAIIPLLEELYVVQIHRGRGLGGALLSAAQEQFSVARGLPMELEVDASHRDVESFYQKHGFTRRDRTRWLYLPPSRRESAP
ncbi:MAG TPA: GNAT family N-acetyltransferase, partial [Chthoniobacteraceae bacterium]|nr:GNAT family N-acetyltransferase [Chthoniobacteraceae bacterium]